MKKATLKEILSYLVEYLQAYRSTYRRFVDSPPHGGGFPKLSVSPLLYSPDIVCYLAKDGYAITDQSREPEKWRDGIGAAVFVADYNIVCCAPSAQEMWTGDLGQLVNSGKAFAEGTAILVKEYDLTFSSLAQRLTFGIFEHRVNLRLPDEKSPFWRPYIVRNIGFMPSDRNNGRFFNYLELSRHLDMSAWDTRAIPTRVASDLRRDFAFSFSSQSQESGGTLSFGQPAPWDSFFDRLKILGQTIANFEKLLGENDSARESLFHDFLRDNSIILDVYGLAISKPRFPYPEGESPLGKQYVEPDFIIKYPNRSYKLVELERPSKLLGTVRGEPRSELSQAAFQIAEWKTFINKHYDRIKNDFPGISVDCSSQIVISRKTEESIGSGRSIEEYLDILKNQYAVDEVFTYDDLLDRAKAAYEKLSSLMPAL
jgi:hypothetical protein